MAFVCTIDPGSLNFDFLADGQAAVAVARIGHDPSLPAEWFLHIGFDIGAGGDVEYYFRLYRFGPEVDDEAAYHSGKATRPHIHGSDRQIILDAVLSGTRELLRRHRPTRLYRVTYDNDLPAAGLEKHHAITSIFLEEGYQITKTETAHGQQMWWLELGTDDSVIDKRKGEEP